MVNKRPQPEEFVSKLRQVGALKRLCIVRYAHRRKPACATAREAWVGFYTQFRAALSR